MAYDEGLADLLRGDLEAMGGLQEKRMFGGLVFMLRGNMLCGVHSGGGMFRVGPEGEPAALQIEGATPMAFTGRRMAGFVEATDEAMDDTPRRQALLTLALAYVGPMPGK